jgi:hypothetical protein
MGITANKNTPPVPLPHGGTKEAGGGRCKARLLLGFFDIHARFINGFDHDWAFAFRHIAPTCLKDVIPSLAGTCGPNHAILALNRHTMLIFQV